MSETKRRIAEISASLIVAAQGANATLEVNGPVLNGDGWGVRATHATDGALTVAELDGDAVLQIAPRSAPESFTTG